jgi:hypothetical protein
MQQIELNIEDINTDNKEERKLYSNFIYSIGNENTRNQMSEILYEVFRC